MVGKALHEQLDWAYSVGDVITQARKDMEEHQPMWLNLPLPWALHLTVMRFVLTVKGAPLAVEDHADGGEPDGEEPDGGESDGGESGSSYSYYSESEED